MSDHAFFDMPDEVIHELMEDRDYDGETKWAQCSCGNWHNRKYNQCYTCFHELMRQRNESY